MAAFEVSGDQVERTAYEGNMDLMRTEYDVQPYSIIGREYISRSGATTVEDLLRQQLTMSTAFSSGAQSATGYGGSASSFSLRGLSSAETLVLINGRRVAGVGRSASTEASDQPDLNGIPLAAIERIEVLPASASAIYGASALGGVINVVLRRGYSGHEFNTRYETTDDGHASIETFNWTSSFQFEGGRSELLISAQYQDTRALYVHQRDFRQKGRQRILENDPAAFYTDAGTTGNPPWGALVNIRSRDGSPLFGPGSSHFTHIPLGYRGWQIDGLQPLIDNQGTYNLDLARGMASGFSADEELIGASRSKSFSLNGSREMTERLRVFLDGGYSHSEQNPYDTWYGARVVTLAADSPNNPFGQDVAVAYPVRNADRRNSSEVNTTIRGERVALGFEYELPRDWRLVGNYSWSHSVNHHMYLTRHGSPTREEAIHDGILDVLRDTTSFPTLIDDYAAPLHRLTNSWSGDSTLRLAGTLGEGWWYGGAITLASGVEHRELRSSNVAGSSSDLHPPPTYRRQQTDSFYAETSVPLVHAGRSIRALYALDAQVAVRHERYNVESVGSEYDTTVPTFGFRWLPVQELILRTSYGRGFRAPTYAQLTVPTFSTSLSTVNDPRRGGEAVEVRRLTGGNPDIVPETSRNLNIGLVWSPRAVPGLRLSADWFKIEKRNNITSPGTQTILDEEALFPHRVIRAAPDPGDPYGVGQVLEVHTYSMNMLMLETSGIDLGARYRLQTGSAGDFETAINATLSDYYRTQTSVTSGVINRLGVPSYSGPLEKRINGSLSWNRRQWNIGWATQYYGSYRLSPTGRGSTTSIRRQGGPRVASQIYHDLFVRYRLAARRRALSNVELTLGVKNVFDKAPPVDMSRSYYYSTFGDPRLRRLYANVKKTF
ncbi:hypothetical protein AXK11_07940 [Cephaloticoccus primus]|uniref:TonB-dependent receptor n=1 Tax=Cephaloticoccus primus TaxID=1548207 RepID=A0A139SJA6_9BACT|nr:hypothetical protein AXK11_07940 [Cephaloticoccus primus]